MADVRAVAKADGWRFANVYEAIAGAYPDRPAILQGDHTVTWSQLDSNANALAADLLATGVSSGGKVAAYLTNSAEYLVTYMAAFKTGVVPVNCNYRYGVEEVGYLLENADAEAVVFHTSFLPVVDHLRDRLPLVRRWYAVADDGAPVPAWAGALDELPSVTDAPAAPRSPEDLLLLYTGGTTGVPKGVMWRQDDLFAVMGGGGNTLLGIDPPSTFDELAARLTDDAPAGPVVLVASPLMHGTGQFSALSALTMGGTVALLPGRRFDVAELWEQADRHQASSIVIVGQAFADPMLEHLRRHRAEYDLSALRLITSSGVMWSQENKDGLLELLPDVVLFDNFGSSEAMGAGGSVSRRGASKQTGAFRLGKRSAVFTEDGRRVEPGTGERGLVAVTGPIPLGYYKDEAKTRQTFRVFEGKRWSVPGDWAEVEADGKVRLLGRGSSCINTAGEKVFPEEVEEVLKTHPAVADAAVVGVPDTRFGELVCAVVEPRAGAAVELGTADLPGFVKARLAGFKAPRHVVLVETIGRAPNGKLDQQHIRALVDSAVTPPAKPAR